MKENKVVPIQFKVTQKQKDRLIELSERNGFKNLSDYIRVTCLIEHDHLSRKLDIIVNMISKRY